ncbi:MAG: hemerythrin domain-containing protein [Gammaproteobacteria bacterium]|nr:hemerythrin domain-containing protein [Candidatus Thioaporhodococcus sediminis]TNF51971.1 MAG: hemerythrin domain-containing protein [Gammaproteobacteria bacterium]
MNETISTFMTEDHRHCDRLLAVFEHAVERGDWEQAGGSGQELKTALLNHFAREEDRLFPQLLAVEARAGGPVNVMTMEHRQMRVLLNDLEQAIGARDRDACLGLVETLHFLNQQHNAKEEGILYPLADQGLAAQMGGILQQLRAG